MTTTRASGSRRALLYQVDTVDGVPPQSNVVLTFDEAMAICLLLAEAADAAVDEAQLRDTWAEEARLMIELVLNRTD